MITLPQAADTLRNEAVEITDAAARVAREMTLCLDAVRLAHDTMRKVQSGLELLRLAIRSGDPEKELEQRVNDIIRDASTMDRVAQQR